MRVKVVMCCHNGAAFLEAQLASIMSQTRAVDVVHVFDFASTDGTRALLEALASRWPVIQVRLVDDAPGVARSFFRALAAMLPACAPADLILLSDQDDVWNPDKVEILVAAIEAARQEQGERIVAFHDVSLVDEDLNVLKRSFYDHGPFRIPRDLTFERLLVANPIIGHTIALTMPMAELAVRILRPERYIMHDWAIALLASQCGRFLFVDRQLSLYRQHSTNILGAGRRRSLLEYARRGLRLSAAIERQARAFADDFARAGPSASRPADARLRSGGKLASIVARHGHTAGHRLMAVPMLWRALRGKPAAFDLTGDRP